jgi:uncharacterized protein YaaQ
MKLVIAIIHRHDQRHVQDNLLECGVQFTNVASTGGFLREGGQSLPPGGSANNPVHM